MKKLLLTIILAAILLFSAAALAEEIVLPDPGYYFGREYKDDAIEFDAYPKAEFDAYTTLLMDDYGLEITRESKGEYGESYFMQMPDVDDSRVIVTCYAPSPNSNGYGLQFFFGDSYVLKDLDVYTPSAECAICSGDAVCDTCGGKGYLEMTAYGSKDTVRVACTGGCTEGKCPACGAGIDLPIPAQDTKTYTPPIVGNDGLIVMSPEQYLGIKPCDQIYQQDNYYVYRYIDRGFEKYGKEDKNLEDWYAMEDYLNALIDSGYYEIIEHTISKTKYVEYWCLGYTGSKPIKVFGANINSTQEAAILIQSHYGDIYVRYSVDILTDDLDETQKRLGENLRLDDPAPSPDDPFSIWERCDVCEGDGKCNYCRGRGYHWNDRNQDCSVCDSGKCYACRGKGHK